MRHEKNGRLLTALAAMEKNPPVWKTPAPADLADDYDVLARQFYAIVVESSVTPPMRDIPHGRQWSTTQEMEEALREERELQGLMEGAVLEPPVYSTKWVRASDEVFAQYAPLAQRRLDPRGTGMPVEPVEGNPCPVCEYPRGTDPVCEQCEGGL